MLALRLAYAANLLILVPVALPTLFRWGRIDQGAFEESAGWRVLVGAFWVGILALSVLGLWQPLRCCPILVLQLIYKSIWLVVYAAPLAWQGEWQRLPAGITVSFLGIVLIWPWLIPWRALADSEG